MSAKDITPENEYQYRYKHRAKEELEEAEKYNCNGICYGNRFMCPYVEACKKTRTKESIVTIFASLFYMGLILLPAAFILLFILWR